MTLLNDEKLCRIHFIFLFDIFYWLCFCIVYGENKYFIDPSCFPYQSEFKIFQGRKIKISWDFHENGCGKHENAREFFLLKVLSTFFSPMLLKEFRIGSKPRSNNHYLCIKSLMITKNVALNIIKL